MNLECFVIQKWLPFWFLLTAMKEMIDQIIGLDKRPLILNLFQQLFIVIGFGWSFIASNQELNSNSN